MQPERSRREWYAPGAVTILIAGLLGGIALDRVLATGVPARDGRASLRLVSEAWNLTSRFYVDRSAAQPRTMAYGAISGMVDALGDTGHSRFLSPLMVKELNNLEQDKFQGIGAQIQLKGGHVVIAVPLDDSPAQRAGLKPGDIILKVNGHDVTGLPLDQVIEEVAGAGRHDGNADHSYTRLGKDVRSQPHTGHPDPLIAECNVGLTAV